MTSEAKFSIAFFLLVATHGSGASFEAASIKPADRDASGWGEDGRNGTLRMYNVSLKDCIRYAYTIADDQVVGGPAWIADRRYNILAKADHPANEPELLTMLQPLLADRFKLEFHRETRTLAGYSLRVAKGGSKLKTADPNRHSGGDGGRGFIDGVSSPLAALTIRLSALLGRPVADMTGEKGNFDYHLRWNPDDTYAVADSATADRPSIFTALQEQLGLRLESEKVPVAVLVIDHAELPSDDY